MFEGDSSSYMLFDGLMEEGLELATEVLIDPSCPSSSAYPRPMAETVCPQWYRKSFTATWRLDCFKAPSALSASSFS